MAVIRRTPKHAVMMAHGGEKVSNRRYWGTEKNGQVTAVTRDAKGEKESAWAVL
jgi:hypothetical protein